MTELQVDVGSRGERLLDGLVERRWIELEPGCDRARLVAGLDRLLANAGDPLLSAGRAAEWLLTRPEVAELFASDAQIASLLREGG